MAVYIYIHTISLLFSSLSFFFFIPSGVDSTTRWLRSRDRHCTNTYTYIRTSLTAFNNAWWKAKSFPWWNFLSLISAQLDAVRLISSRTPKTDTWNEFSTERTNALLNRCLKGCASLFHPLPFSLPPIPIESITGNKPFLFNFPVEFPADIDETMGWFKKFFLFFFFMWMINRFAFDIRFCVWLIYSFFVFFGGRNISHESEKLEIRN